MGLPRPPGVRGQGVCVLHSGYIQMVRVILLTFAVIWGGSSLLFALICLKEMRQKRPAASDAAPVSLPALAQKKTT